MPDELGSAAGSLSDQTKKIDIASYYTHGDMEKAKEMVAGSYNDAYAIKGRFISSTMNGAFISFINKVYDNTAGTFVVISQSRSIEKLKTNIDWRTYEKEIDTILKEGEHDEDFTQKFKLTLSSAYSLQFLTELKKMVEKNDEIAINRYFQKYIQDSTGYQNVDISIDYEHISSLAVELESISSIKIDKSHFEKDEKEKAEPKIELESDEEVLKGKDVKLILRGNVILSPIKGREISSLAVGDRIRISITDKGPKAIQVLKAFNAYEDGKTKPVTGRVVSHRRLPAGGYKLFTVIAKGIYVKIEEEEENIKVSLESPSLDSGPGSKEDSSRGIILIVTALILAAVALIGIVLYFSK